MHHPVQTPGFDAMRQVLHHLAEARPDHRILSRLDPQRRTWTPVGSSELDEWMTRLVVPVASLDEDAEAVVEDWLSGDPDGPPFRLGLGRDAYVVDFSHAVGDWSYVYLIINELFAAALDGGRPPRGLLTPPTAFPLARALAHYYGRDPRRVVQTLRTAPNTESQRGANEPADRSAVTRPAVVTARFPEAARAGLTAWRRYTAPHVSSGAALFALLSAVLADSGLSCAPGASILVDSRRWLPPNVRVEGNCATAVLMVPSDARDPVAWAAELDHVLGSGRPLAATAHAAATSVLPRNLPGRLSARSTPEQTQISVSYYRDPSEGCLPWKRDADNRHHAVLLAGDEGDAIGFLFYSTSRSLHVSANFDPTRHGRPLLSEIVERVADAPVHLLTQRRPQRVQA